MNRLCSVIGDAFTNVKRSMMLGHVPYGTADALFALSYAIVFGFGIVRYREGASCATVRDCISSASCSGASTMSSQ